jgi:uncharacterized protein (DUF885 family)
MVGWAHSSIAAVASGPDQAGDAAGAELNALADSYFEKFLQLNPVAATFIGDHRYDDRLNNWLSAEYLTASRTLEQQTLDALARIDERKLGEQDRLTWAVMQARSRTYLDGLAFPTELLPLDQFNNDATFFAQMGSGNGIHRFATVKDYENFLSRIDGFVDWADQAIVNMQTGVRRGIVHPRVIMEKVVPQLAAHVVSDPARSVFWQPVANMPEAFSAADRERLTAAYRAAIMEKIVPAYRRLHDHVRIQYLPKCRNTVGLSALPQGAEWYAYLVRANTGTATTATQLHQLGREEGTRIRGEIERLMRNTGFRGSFPEFVRFLRTDSRFYYRTPEALIDAYRSRLPKAMNAVPRLFSLTPKAPIEIRRFEAYRETTQAAAEYYPPSGDGSRAAIFFVNGHDLPSRPKYEIDGIFLHEAIPGHHFQIALALEIPDLPRVRRFAGVLSFAPFADATTAYAEGWGLYAESLGEELGFYSDPYQRIGALFLESWRAARLVVDTGMHAQGWTREQAIDYMRAETATGDTDIVAEIDRYIVWPGQALAYKVGQLTIRRLRTRAEQQLGARFDVRDFHAQVLDDGPMPLSVLEAKIGRWIEAQR